MIPFYDPFATFEENFERGPFGLFAEGAPYVHEGTPREDFLGEAVFTPFGIAAGPLLNARYCEAAFRHGFDVNVYKTVRSRAHAVHAFPNTLAVHVDGPLTLERAAHPVFADADFGDALAGGAPVSITNSFGVPSRDPAQWQPDMAAAVASAGPGQVLVASFQATLPEVSVGADAMEREAAYVADHVLTARLVAETGARVMELNLSCPNEGTASLLCFERRSVARIVRAVKDAIGDTPLVLKLAYFPDDGELARFVAATSGTVQGYAAVNTIPAKLLGRDGRQALPGEGRAVGGVCGPAIAWAGLDMVRRLVHIREQGDEDFAVIGVGGVGDGDGYLAMRHAGADAVFSATGAMFDPMLGRTIQALRLAENRAN